MSANIQRTAVARPGLLLALAMAFCLSVAWLVPLGKISALFGWLAAILLVLLFKQPRSARWLYLAGTISYLASFYWLAGTIHDFGGLPVYVAYLLLLLFALSGALLFVFAAFLHKMAHSLRVPTVLAPAISWCIAESVFPQIFPWQLAHTQVGFSVLIQIADLGGSSLVSFLLLVTAAVILEARHKPRAVIAVGAIFSIWIGYGVTKVAIVEGQRASASSINVSVLQGNIPIELKHTPELYRANVRLYSELTETVSDTTDLIIWPESVMLDWVFEGVGHVSRDSRLPTPPRNAALLFGALTFRDENTKFNSSLLILPNGDIPLPAHKQILMPFGEYTPFGDALPWLREINHTVADFTPGEQTTILRANFNNHDIKISALNCYEDVVPSIARQASLRGANLLINQTNDAWFGRTAAPYQHHAIATMRAVENRRFLIRATNTGLSAIVDPPRSLLIF
jgi:apolipoprotein N-acyltransferase